MKRDPNKKEQAQSLGQITKNNLFLLKIALKEAPVYTINTLFDQILHEVVVFIEHIYMIAFVIDCIQYQKPFRYAFWFILLVFIGVTITHTWGNYVVARLKPKAIEKINRRVRLMLYDKASQIDLSCYDDPQFYNDFVWAMSDATTRVEKVLTTTSRFLGAIVGACITGGFVLAQDGMGLVFALAAFVLTVVVAIKANKLQFALDNELKPKQRKRDYVSRVLYLSDYAKEIRLSDVKEKLYEDFLDANEDVTKSVDKHTKKLAFYDFIMQYVCNSLIFDGLYIIYLLFMTIVKKAFTYGTMVALYNSCSSLKDNLANFSAVLPEFVQHSLYIEKIKLFLAYDVKVCSPKDALPAPKHAGTLQLKDVSFAYNENSTPILKHINLTIHGGEKIALVGYNGAGKTTLVKLLMRLYDATEGEVLYDGEDIRRYDLDGYRGIFGTVFQDYQLFAATLGENVAMDNRSLDRDRAVQALADGGFGERLSTLEKGLDTPLTKEFEDTGTNLSGGESQKVAISRALYQDSPVIILDEPSSALDPISEYNLNNTMLHLDPEKTVVFISHRLSTTRMADRIYMLEEGEIIEQGTHDELMALGGKYAQMFQLQAEKYR